MEGIGEFYGGILHPLLVLPHALSLLVFAVLVGQAGVRAMRFTYPPFLLALLAGLVLAGFQVQPALPYEKILLVLAMACGLLAALQSALPVPGLALLGAVLALLIGMDSGVIGLSRQQTFAALCGCWLGGVLLLVLVAGIAEMAQRSWQRVALRVLGSWTAASGALVLALALRPDI
jgi:urease accessory protein